jgi:hypothetical protein
MDILMLGRSNAGKTSYVSAMYEAMSAGVGGFIVRAERAADHQRLRRNAQQMRAGTFPDASSRRSIYQLQLWHGEARVLDFVWRDYRGGALTEGSSSAQAVQLREDMERADGLVLVIDSTELTGSTRSRAAVRPLVSTAIRLLSTREHVMPVVVALTKWDLVVANPQQTNDAATELLGDLVNAIANTQHLFGAMIPVACGREPVNVVLPVLWCLHVGIAIRGALLQQRIDDHEQLSKIAELRQGVWDNVRSWWNNEPTWREVRVAARQQIESDFQSLYPLIKPSQQLEQLLKPVYRF